MVGVKLVSVICVMSFIAVNNVIGSQDVMKKLTLGFSKALDDCRQELSLGDHIMQDFYNFWREEYELVNRDLGCAIMCLAAKLDLVTDDAKIHHVNAMDFAKKHGADDVVAKQLVEMIHDCHTQHSGVADECSRTLEAAKCFRTKIHDLKWAPSMETVLEEIMADMKSQ